jgi:hypothetical protein
MTSQYCTRCQTVTTSNVTTSKRKAGKDKTVTTYTFHCSACSSFLRNEDVDTLMGADQPGYTSGRSRFTDPGEYLPKSGAG